MQGGGRLRRAVGRGAKVLSPLWGSGKGAPWCCYRGSLCRGSALLLEPDPPPLPGCCVKWPFIQPQEEGDSSWSPVYKHRLTIGTRMFRRKPAGPALPTQSTEEFHRNPCKRPSRLQSQNHNNQQMSLLW